MTFQKKLPTRKKRIWTEKVAEAPGKIVREPEKFAEGLGKIVDDPGTSRKLAPNS